MHVTPTSEPDIAHSISPSSLVIDNSSCDKKIKEYGINKSYRCDKFHVLDDNLEETNVINKLAEIINLKEQPSNLNGKPVMISPISVSISGSYGVVDSPVLDVPLHSVLVEYV